MEERERAGLVSALTKAFPQSAYKGVLSNPVGAEEAFRRIELNRSEGAYLVEKYTKTQVFHERMSYAEAKDFLLAMLGGRFRSFNAWDGEREYMLKISKKGKALAHSRRTEAEAAPKERTSHDREKSRILPKDVRIEPLVDMGVLTQEGKIVRSMYDKYRQINRFLEIVDDEVKRSDKKSLTVLDFGCGKSYLTFVLYYYLTQVRGLDVRMTGLDLKEDVVNSCAAAAERYGYRGLTFRVGDIRDYAQEEKIDIVVTLHACDTATDYALCNAIRWDADMIFSVPCCQHELNGQMRSERFGLFTRYGIVKERMAALTTDAIRCNLLEACGYRTQMVEFVAFEHTPKNIMIRAVKKRGEDKGLRLREAEAVMEEFHLQPTLYRLLQEAGRI